MQISQCLVVSKRIIALCSIYDESNPLERQHCGSEAKPKSFVRCINTEQTGLSGCKPPFLTYQAVTWHGAAQQVHGTFYKLIT